MVDYQVLIKVKPCSQEINKNIIARKLDLTYDLETILEKLNNRIEK